MSIDSRPFVDAFRTLGRTVIVLGLTLGACTSSRAGDPVVFHPPTGSKPTFQKPYRLQVNEKSKVKPIWTKTGVQAVPPALPKGEGYGIPVYDPESQAWYATLQGSLVLLGTDGSRKVILEDVRAIDLDVRAKRSLAVSREPDDTIVLHKWNDGTHQRKVLLSGPQFFNPRFSPDGSKVLVAESRAGGGHIWLAADGAVPVDLGQGYGASWHPDGEQIIFTRIAHDGRTIASSDVFLLDSKTRQERKLAHSEAPAALEPVISPDGKWIAFSDKTKRNAFVVEFPASTAK